MTNGCSLSIKDEPIKTEPINLTLRTNNAAIYTGNAILTFVIFTFYMLYYLLY